MITNPDFYDVDREYFLSLKPLNQRLSCNFLDFDYADIDDYYKKSNQWILKSFYSMFNFLSGESIPVLNLDPNSNDNSCGLIDNIINLGTKSFSDIRFGQQTKVDTKYATMIHELWHKRYTIGDILKEYFPNASYLQYYSNKKFEHVVTTNLRTQLHGSIFNILEDRRIERLGVKEYPGYVFFFDVKREYAAEIRNGIEITNETALGLPLEYLLIKILIPELEPSFIARKELFFLGASKQIKDDKKTIDEAISKLKRYVESKPEMVLSDSIRTLFQATEEIYNLLPTKVKLAAEKMIEKGKVFVSPEVEFFMSVGSEENKDKDYTEEKGDEIGTFIFNEQLEEEEEFDFDGGDTSDADFERSRIEKIEIINAHSKRYDTVKIYNPKAAKEDKIIYREALKISRNIARSLGFLESKLNQLNQAFELNEGELDEDELYAISYSSNIFYEEEPKPGFELDFGILIDESGSMNEAEKRRNAVIAALSILLSTKESKHINLFVYGHSYNRYQNKKDGVQLYEYYNSKRRITNWKNIYAVKARGGNADGYAIAKMGEIMLKDSKCKKKIMVVISDGYPAADHYGGVPAEQHVKEVVNLLEKRGIEVIQICLENMDRSAFMFNNFIPFDNMGKFIKDFVDILNKKLSRFTENI